MRIGINIPNELMKRIDPFRSEINLSQVCRDAIEKLADTHERVKERAAADGLEARIIRLVEPPIMEPDWVGYALDDARDWVASVDPDDWNYFFYLYDFFKSKGRDASELADRPNLRGVKRFWDRYNENRKWFDRQYESNEDANPLSQAREEYSRAWMGYVEEVRRKQLQYLQNRRKEALAERERGLQVRPEPEAPHHLLS